MAHYKAIPENKARTIALLAYINDPTHKDIFNVTEDDTFIYFHANTVHDAMMLRAIGYDTWYQESKDVYKIRVLKPDWFSKGLEGGE